MRAKYGKGKGIGTTLARRFLYQILQGIQYCHANGVMHRDLKPANLLVDMKSSAIKIADFGLGRVTDIPVLQYSTEVITLWYRAPEILLSSDQYSCKVDVWSVGCIFAELLTGKAIFDGKWQIHTLFKIFEKLGTPTEESWPGVTSLPEWHVYPTWEAKPMKDITDWPKNIGRKALALLKGMLELDPAKRISAEEALKSPYFDGFRNNNSAPGEIDSSPVSENSTPGARGAGSSAGSSSRKRRNKKK